MQSISMCSVGWIHAIDLNVTGQRHGYTSSITPDDTPTLPVTGSGPVGLIVIAGVGLLMVGVLVRTVGRRRTRKVRA